MINHSYFKSHKNWGFYCVKEIQLPLCKICTDDIKSIMNELKKVELFGKKVCILFKRNLLGGFKKITFICEAF